MVSSPIGRDATAGFPLHPPGLLALESIMQPRFHLFRSLIVAVVAVTALSLGSQADQADAAAFRQDPGHAAMNEC